MAQFTANLGHRVVDYFPATHLLFSGKYPPPLFPHAHWVVGWVLASRCLSGYVEKKKKFRNHKSDTLKFK
jgi:hypothetical protein